MSKEVVVTSHFGKSNEARATNPSFPYHQIGSYAKEFDKRKQRRKRTKKGRITTSHDVGSGEDFLLTRMRAAQKRRTTKKATKLRSKLQIV